MFKSMQDIDWIQHVIKFLCTIGAMYIKVRLHWVDRNLISKSLSGFHVSLYNCIVYRYLHIKAWQELPLGRQRPLQWIQNKILVSSIQPDFSHAWPAFSRTEGYIASYTRICSFHLSGYMNIVGAKWLWNDLKCSPLHALQWAVQSLLALYITFLNCDCTKPLKSFGSPCLFSVLYNQTLEILPSDWSAI